MRILYLSQYFPPEIGATQSRAIEMATGLVRSGHEVTVLCEVPNHPHGVVAPAYRWKLYKQREIDGVRVIHVWVKTSPEKSRWGRIAFYVSYMCMAVVAGVAVARGKYDVIYSTSPPIFTGAAGLALRWLRRTPLVFEVRDLWPQAAVELGLLRGRRAIKWASRLERACYRKAQAIVAVTEGDRADIVGRGVPGKKVSVIPNGVNTSIYIPQAADEALRASLGLTPDHYVAMYAGLHGLAHGLETIIQAAQLLRNDESIRFVFLGDGPRKNALQKMAGDLALGNVIFHAPVPEEALPSYLALANVGLDCRRKIGLSKMTLPVKMFSYMACAVPVILCIEGEAIDLLAAAGAGTAVAPEDPQALAHAILEHMSGGGPTAAQLAHARRYVNEHFSRKELAAQLARLLEALPADAMGWS